MILFRVVDSLLNGEILSTVLCFSVKCDDSFDGWMILFRIGLVSLKWDDSFKVLRIILQYSAIVHFKVG